MNMTGRIDRRALLAAGVATPVAVTAVSARSSDAADRPDLMLRQEAADRWQWCSWRHDGGCWRPVRGQAQANGASGIAVSGALPVQDRAELVALFGDVAPGRVVSFAPER